MGKKKKNQKGKVSNFNLIFQAVSIVLNLFFLSGTIVFMTMFVRYANQINEKIWICGLLIFVISSLIRNKLRKGSDAYNAVNFIITGVWMIFFICCLFLMAANGKRQFAIYFAIFEGLSLLWKVFSNVIQKKINEKLYS